MGSRPQVLQGGKYKLTKFLEKISFSVALILDRKLLQLTIYVILNSKIVAILYHCHLVKCF